MCMRGGGGYTVFMCLCMHEYIHHACVSMDVCGYNDASNNNSELSVSTLWAPGSKACCVRVC